MNSCHFYKQPAEYHYLLVLDHILSELRTQNSEIVYLTLNLQIHAIHKLNN